MIDLRLRVLRIPLGLSYTPEDLGAEAGDVHIVGYLGDKMVACLLLSPQSPARCKMRQVAVDAEFQGRGIGSKLVAFSEALAKERGVAEIILNARESAVPFYLHLGYQVVSERFFEVTLPHFAMQKLLH